jgi:hypothetical protein
MDLDDAGYNFLMRKERPPNTKGSFRVLKKWSTGQPVAMCQTSCFHSCKVATWKLSIYSSIHTHSGSGMAQPTAEASLNGGVLDVAFHDQCDSGFRTLDYCRQPMVFAIRLYTDAVKSVRVRGIQITEHNFVVGGVTDETRALTILRGIDELKGENDDEMRSPHFHLD